MPGESDAAHAVDRLRRTLEGQYDDDQGVAFDSRSWLVSSRRPYDAASISWEGKNRRLLMVVVLFRSSASPLTRADARFTGHHADRASSDRPTARSSVLEDGTSDPFPVGRINAVPSILQQEQPRSRDPFRRRFAVLHGEHRICRAVDDQGWCGDRGQGPARDLALGQHAVVLHGCEIAGTLDVVAHQASRRRLVKCPPLSREHAGVVEPGNR